MQKDPAWRFSLKVLTRQLVRETVLSEQVADKLTRLCALTLTEEALSSIGGHTFTVKLLLGPSAFCARLDRTLVPRFFIPGVMLAGLPGR